MQRQGFPNLTVQLYKSYTAYEDNIYLNLTPSMVTLTMRDGMISGVNEGLLQIYDDGELHTKLTGNELIRIVVATANTDHVQARTYAIKDFSTTIDKKSDNMITFQLALYHDVYSVKFSTHLENNAGVSLTKLIDSVYLDKDLLKPKIKTENVIVPPTNWSLGVQEYKQFITKHGLSVQNETIPLVYESFDGITLTDYETMTEKEPLTFMLVDPDTIGELGNITETPIIFDFEWLTKQNKKEAEKYNNITYYTHSFKDKNLRNTVVGNGHNISLSDRAGGYHTKLDKVGNEENIRYKTMSTNEGYSSGTIYGDFRIQPTDKLYIFDVNGQTDKIFYVDEVVHEISQEQSITTLYMFNS